MDRRDGSKLALVLLPRMANEVGSVLRAAPDAS